MRLPYFYLSLLILASPLALASAEEFPCAEAIRANLGAEAFAKDLSLVRSIALLSSRPDMPNSEALAQWREMKGYVSDRTDLETYPKLEVDCADQHLYPTHPQQELKHYHRFDSSQYNQAKLKGTDEPCLIRSPGVAKGRPSYCLRADIAYDAIISDTFEDACGHFYRGFKEVAYLGKSETMGTLFSAGRTTLPKPGSKIEGELVPGHTYAVPVKDLVFVGPLFPNDQAEIMRLRESAKAASEFDPPSRTYRMKP